jgi:hypothetical protein
MRLLLALLLIMTCSFCHAVQIERLPFASGERAGQPSVTVDPREGFVVTWQERIDSGSALRYSVIDADGSERRRGTVVTGDDWFINGADFPSLVVLDNGDWVTFFLQKTSPGTYSYAVHTLRSRDAGASWDPPLVIHRDGTDTEHGFVTLVADGGDRVRAVWLDGRHMAGAGDAHAHGSSEHMTLRSAAWGRDGRLQDEHEIDDLTCACCQTDAVRVGGRMRVAYRDRSAGEVRDIATVEFVDGAWTAPRILHADGWVMPACPVNGPALAVNSDRVATLWPTMAGGEMRLLLGFGDAETVQAIATGPTELGRVDLAAWRDGQWLAARVAAPDHGPTLWLSLLASDGDVQREKPIAAKVGGYPRLATRDGVGLLVWAEQGETPGSSRIGLARVSSAAR